jgi:hypothetical protein
VISTQICALPADATLKTNRACGQLSTVALSRGGEQAEFRHRHRLKRERLASGVLPDDQTS